MKSRRWNWLVLVGGGVIAALVGVAGFAAGAFESSGEPIVFLVLGAGLIIAGLVMRRRHRRYEAEAMATASRELDATASQPDA